MAASFSKVKNLVTKGTAFNEKIKEVKITSAKIHHYTGCETCGKHLRKKKRNECFRCDSINCGDTIREGIDRFMAIKITLEAPSTSGLPVEIADVTMSNPATVNLLTLIGVDEITINEAKNSTDIFNELVADKLLNGKLTGSWGEKTDNYDLYFIADKIAKKKKEKVEAKVRCEETVAKLEAVHKWIADQSSKRKIVVEYGSNGSVNFGNKMNISVVGTKPKIVNYIGVKKFKYYLLAMMDSSIIRGQEKLWLVGNVKASSVTLDFSEATVMAEYFGPQPSNEEEEEHRYIFMLFEQPGKIDFKVELPAIKGQDERRQGWKIKKFARKYKLMGPVASNYFTI